LGGVKTSLFWASLVSSGGKISLYILLSGLMSDIGRAIPWCIISAFKYSPFISFYFSPLDKSLIGFGYGKLAMLFFYGIFFK
jgi:hypothetical protein